MRAKIMIDGSKILEESTELESKEYDRCNKILEENTEQESKEYDRCSKILEESDR